MAGERMLGSHDADGRASQRTMLETSNMMRRWPLAVPVLVIASQSLCGGRTKTVGHQDGGYQVAHGGKMLMPPQIPC
jgi:hypothetical protein